MEPVFDWVRAHPALLTSLGIGSILMFIGSALALPFLVSRMPAEYFVKEADPQDWAQQHPALRLLLLVLKNGLGAVLLLAGIAMLFLPGQGILTILVSLTLLNFPGKRALELRIARERHVRAAIAWLRERAGSPPLEFPSEGDG